MAAVELVLDLTEQGHVRSLPVFDISQSLIKLLPVIRGNEPLIAACFAELDCLGLVIFKFRGRLLLIIKIERVVLSTIESEV